MWRALFEVLRCKAYAYLVVSGKRERKDRIKGAGSVDE